MARRDFWCLIGIAIVTIIMMAAFILAISDAVAQGKPENPCKIYYDKSIELANESTKDLPPGQTVDFDPRVAKSNSSIAYSWIYKNCKEYGN